MIPKSKWLILSSSLSLFCLTPSLGAHNEALSTAPLPIASTFRDPLSKAFTSVSKKATPAVVFLKAKISPNRGDYDSREGYNQPPFDLEEDFFNRFFGVPRNPPREQAPDYSRGSGFLVKPNGLYSNQCSRRSRSREYQRRPSRWPGT
jgi:serine protease Do